MCYWWFRNFRQMRSKSERLRTTIISHHSPDRVKCRRHQGWLPVEFTLLSHESETNLGPSPHGALMQPEKSGKLQMMHKNVRILSNSAKFSAGRPLLPAYNFSTTMASTCSTYRFAAVPSLKFLAT